MYNQYDLHLDPVISDPLDIVEPLLTMDECDMGNDCVDSIEPKATTDESANVNPEGGIVNELMATNCNDIIFTKEDFHFDEKFSLDEFKAP